MNNEKTKNYSDSVRDRFGELDKAITFRKEGIESKGKLASATGFANEQRFLAALLSRGYNASRIDLPHSSYDIITELTDKNMIRVQVKTVGKSSSVSFIGGTRGGVDRDYKSGVKEFIQNTDKSDIVVGVNCIIDNGDSNIDYYFVPTLLIEKLNQKSLSINKIPDTKNCWELFENCKNEQFVTNFFKNFFYPS